MKGNVQCIVSGSIIQRSDKKLLESAISDYFHVGEWWLQSNCKFSIALSLIASHHEATNKGKLSCAYDNTCSDLALL